MLYYGVLLKHERLWETIIDKITINAPKER